MTDPAVAGASTIKDAQAQTGRPLRCIARQAKASGRPQGASTASASHAWGSMNAGIPRAAVIKIMPSGSQASESRMEEKKPFAFGSDPDLSSGLRAT